MRFPASLLCKAERRPPRKSTPCLSGRALYDGSLSDEKLMPLVEKYGLII